MSLLFAVSLAALLGTWQPKPIGYPISLYILPPPLFEAMRLQHDAPPQAQAFAVRGLHWCNIFIQPHTLRYLLHEIKHCTDGAWHD